MVTRRDCIRWTSVILGSSALGSLSALAQGARLSASAGQPTPSMNYAPQYIAVGKKFIAEEGLDLKLLTSASGEKLREVLGAGQVQFALGDSSHPILLTNRGRPAKMLFAIDNRSALCNLVIRKDIYDKGVTSIEKLSEWKRPDGGKPVLAVASLGGGQHVYVSYLCERLGISDRFVWLAGGGVRTMLGGLSTAKFDAISALPNWMFESVAKGWGEAVFNVTDDAAWNKYIGGPVPGTVGFALQSTIDSSPEIVQAYVNGVYHALRWMKSASESDVFQAVYDPFLKDFPEDVIKQEITFYRHLTSYDGVVDEKQFANASPIWFRDLTELKRVEYKDAVEPKFIRAAIRKFG
jgi:NitT/TauT family transport system substrate-binding protein